MSNMIDCDNGTKAAPNVPCNSRNTTICVSDCATPHIIDVTVNPTRQTSIRFFRPNLAANQPTGAVMIAAAVIYDVRTQVISFAEADKLPCIYGNATLAIVESKA